MVKPSIYFITGEQGAGKTTRLLEVLKILKEGKVYCRGFFAKGEWSKDIRSRFYIEDVNSGIRKLLCQDQPKNEYKQIGRFYFNMETILFGKKLLSLKTNNEAPLFVIDEIGLFEIKGEVWAKSLTQLIENNESAILITIRKTFLTEVIEKFKIKHPHVFELSVSAEKIANTIMETSK